MALGDEHTVGLKSDGTVVAVGRNFDGQCDVSDWRGITSVSAGTFHTVGLKSDGTVVAAGTGFNGECRVSEWRNIVAVSAGGGYTVGLKADGTVVAVGNNFYGQCDVDQWRDIVAVSAGYTHTAGLRADGTVVAVGYGRDGECDVDQWRNIIAITTGRDCTIGIASENAAFAAPSPAPTPTPTPTPAPAPTPNEADGLRMGRYSNDHVIGEFEWALTLNADKTFTFNLYDFSGPFVLSGTWNSEWISISEGAPDVLWLALTGSKGEMIILTRIELGGTGSLYPYALAIQMTPYGNAYVDTILYFEEGAAQTSSLPLAPKPAPAAAFPPAGKSIAVYINERTDGTPAAYFSRLELYFETGRASLTINYLDHMQDYIGYFEYEFDEYFDDFLIEFYPNIGWDVPIYSTVGNLEFVMFIHVNGNLKFIYESSDVLGFAVGQLVYGDIFKYQG